MNTLALLILQSTRQDQRRRRTVQVVRETEHGWDAVPLDDPKSVLPFPRYHWAEYRPEPEQKAGAV